MELQILVLVILFLSFAFLGKLVFHNIINPITMMCGIWAIILFAYSFHAYELYYASDKSLLLIAIGVMMFFCGSVFMCLIKRFHMESEYTTFKYETQKPNYRLLIVLNILAIVCFFGFLVETIQLLRRGIGFNYIHRFYDMEEGTIGGSQFSHYIQEWFVWPLCLATSPLAAISFLSDGEKTAERKWFLITTIINLAMFVVITGKRANIGYVVIYFVMVMMLQRRKVQMKFRTKVLLLGGLIALIAAFNYITVSRGSESIFRSLYIYLCGCVPCFSIKLDGIPISTQYGLMSFHGIYRAPMILISSIISLPSFIQIRRVFAQLITYTQERVFIGPGMGYNAFVTPFFYFYVDFGLIGVIVLSFLFGMFCTSVYIKYLKQRSYRSLSIYLLVAYGIFMSMVRFQFVQMRYVLAFLYLLLPYAKTLGVRITLKNKRHTI